MIALLPERAYGHVLLGLLSYERGDHITGVRALRRALALDPSDADVRFGLGVALMAADRIDIRMGYEWVALDPLSPLANVLVAASQLSASFLRTRSEAKQKPQDHCSAQRSATGSGRIFSMPSGSRRALRFLATRTRPLAGSHAPWSWASAFMRR